MKFYPLFAGLPWASLRSFGALALVVSLSTCGKSEDPRVFVMSLVTGITPGTENGSMMKEGMRLDYSVKTTPGVDYERELTMKISRPAASEPVESKVKFVMRTSADGCSYKIITTVDGGLGGEVDYDFRKFVGLVYQDVPGSRPALRFGQCGVKMNGACKDTTEPAPIFDGTDASRKLLESYAKKMREEICKPS